ncbi:MAG: CRISPR-associated endonuclease Cas3'' [Campylobacterota bacterium]|nr:CRISPR-associated endonuclease Cas3'' [Campylobacterota bacterium]
MIVTFISQCEKNALKRTRRVLDAFANRIGDNTWQTIITQEGLNAVQKLLRKTASKSTAVSCHWIRSRSRSDFLWVVGNREAFDENGVVAVNYGLTKRFIGEKEIMLDKIYANTNGQRLDQHLFGVGYLAKKLIEKIVPEDDNLAEAVYVAGLWHDIGKIDENFQAWVLKELKKQKKYKDIPDEGVHIDKNTGKFSWQKYPRHNEFSLLLFEILFESNLNDDSLKRVRHAIYWHHAKPLRSKKEEIKKVIGIYNKIEDFETTYKDIIDKLQGIQGYQYRTKATFS